MLRREPQGRTEETPERGLVEAVVEPELYFINRQKADPNDKDWQMGRNYQLFRYMLACNAYGEYPTKFNGGLFTIDPALWGSRGGSKGAGSWTGYLLLCLGF